MTRWIALLRGVNVGGITIRSAEFAELFRDQGHSAVKTVLASGNVAFDSDDPADALKSAIEKALSDRFGYTAWIVLVDRASVAAIAAAYPFAREDDVVQPYVVFGSDPGVLDELHAALAAAGEPAEVDERLARGDGVLYWTVPKGESITSPGGKVLAKTRYKSSTTNRNLRTVEKLATA